MIEEFIRRSFANRDSAHLAHWQTKSFAKHSALGEFYESLVDKVDDMVETHQGGMGLVGDVKGVDAADVTETLRTEYVWLTANRKKVCNDIPALENKFDEITALYLRTIYKLENLE